MLKDVACLHCICVIEVTGGRHKLAEICWYIFIHF